MSLLRTLAAFGAGFAAARFIEAKAQGVPLDAAFQPGNLLRSVSSLAAARLQAARPVVSRVDQRTGQPAMIDAEISN